MRTPCVHYSFYQRYFNRCLREWYVQREGGSGFYYADPPGILFTALRSSKSQNGRFEVPMSHWYFDAVRVRPKAQMASLRPSILATNGEERLKPVESFLHIGYNLWYTKVLAACVQRHVDTYHVSFCNDYGIAFNTLFNIGRRLTMHPEDFKRFDNFRLLTGNIFSIKVLLTEQYFKCVSLSVSTKSFKHMMHIKTLSAINDIMTNDGFLIILVNDKETWKKIRETFQTERVSKMFARFILPSSLLCDSTDGGSMDDSLDVTKLEDPDTIEFLKILLQSQHSSDELGLTDTRVSVGIYNKRVSTLPNQMLRKPVDTK